MSTSLSTIRPNEGESYSDFVYRAHYALMHEIPNPYRRNEAVWQAWESKHGDPLANQSQEYFARDQYRFVPKKVCYFTEHMAPPPGPGLPAKKYDFPELARIVDAANEKIDGDYYPAISSQHNPRDPKAPKNPQTDPFIAGYMGEHRLGMVGRTNPKWSIFVDEFHDNRHRALFDNRRRRSVEALHPKDGRPPFFDPVALLGSEPPRLPLPVAQYSASDCDHYFYSAMGEAEHYEFSEASGSNTFIPNHRSNYQGTDSMNAGFPNQPQSNFPSQSQPQQPPSQSSLSPDDVNSIVAALMQTPQMQFVTELMGQQQGGPPQSGQSNQPAPFAGGQQSPQHQSNGQPRSQLNHHSNGQYDPAGAGQDPKSNLQFYSQGNDEMTPEQYSAIQGELENTREQYSALAERNSALESSYGELQEAHKSTIQQMGEMRKHLSQLSEVNLDSQRTIVIRDLYSQYPNFIDQEEELARCLYSRGASMTDSEFGRHVEDLKRYAKKSPVSTAMIPGGEFARPVFNSNPAFEQQVADLTVEMYSAEASNGVYRDYGAIEAEARQRLSNQPAK